MATSEYARKHLRKPRSRTQSPRKFSEHKLKRLTRTSDLRPTVANLENCSMNVLVRLMFSPYGNLNDNNQDAILLHYRTYMTPKKLFSMAKKSLRESRHSRLSCYKGRLLCILEKWVLQYYYPDFVDCENLINQLVTFVDEHYTPAEQLAHPIKSHLNTLSLRAKPFKIHELQYGRRRTVQILNKNLKECRNNIKTFVFTSVLSLALQWIKLEAEWFCMIPPVDWLCDLSELNPSPLSNFGKWFNHISGWVTSCVVTSKNQLVEVMEKFIEISKICWKYKSFNTVFEILAGLNDPAIHRISEVWRGNLNPSLSQFLEFLEKNFSPKDNYFNYRKQLKNCEALALPFIGLCVTDITLWKETNLYHKSLLSDVKNFSKEKILWDTEFVFNSIVPFQQKASLYERVIGIEDDVRRFLLETVRLSTQEIWEISEMYL